MLAADSRICFLCCSFFFNIYNIIIIVIILCLSVLCNSVKDILELNYCFQGEEGQFFHYYQMLLQSMCTKCIFQTAHRWCWTVVSRPINISALMMIIKRNFALELLVLYLGQLLAKSQLQVSIFFGVSMEVELS